MQPLQNSVWTLVSGWCRHHWHQLPATFYTTPSLCCTYHTVVQVGILQTCFRACRPQRAKGHLGSLLGFESLHPVYDYEPAALSLSTTPGYMSLQKLFHSAVSRPGIGVCWQCFTVISGLIEVFQCFSTPYMTWGTRVNDFDTWTGIINIHMKSFPGQFLALAYTVFPVFPDHLEIDSTNWTITVASLTQLMLSQRCTWANHISISNCEVEAGRVEQDSGVPDVVPALKPSPYSACPEPLW